MDRVFVSFMPGYYLKYLSMKKTHAAMNICAATFSSIS